MKEDSNIKLISGMDNSATEAMIHSGEYNLY